MEKFKITWYDYVTNYLRTISFMFLAVIIMYAFLAIDNDHYLGNLVTSVARTIPYVVVGNIIIAYFYSLILKNRK
ncbi:MAG: hypothetical protein ACSHWW_11575 [Nonlabens sp.]|uniref:hypothetical protein n=1 Tax=Nonlabens sp. TaxID=1888209 RepID=UPI003EF7C2FD